MRSPQSPPLPTALDGLVHLLAVVILALRAPEFVALLNLTPVLRDEAFQARQVAVEQTCRNQNICQWNTKIMRFQHTVLSLANNTFENHKPSRDL